MRFDKLHLAGFKSFCEPTEFKIEPGLTGVVGPNGCGKSNLVEALRWVMGEHSYKSMRASGMEDVIFSGSGGRPARNIAEVGVVLDNSDRKAPAAFNDAEVIHVTRRIEREAGSTYRINGREVRARDVQLLFADASTGARSPALVRQGQIGELISAKPQARRLILEEAAGVSGLHSRRHEAELRLKGAEENLVRLDDVLGQIEQQIESLNRQARQARRYKALAAEIRRQEALALHISWRDEEERQAEAQRRLDADIREVADRTADQVEAARLQGLAAAAVSPLREEEARAGAALHRLVLARDALDGEERRAKERTAELAARIAQLAQDAAREAAQIEDASASIRRLAEEDAALAEAAAAGEAASAVAAMRLTEAERVANAAEARLGAAQAAVADLNARRNALAAAVAEEAQRLARFEAECETIAGERDRLAAETAEHVGEEGGPADLAALTARLAEAEADAVGAEARHTEAREAEAAGRAPLAEAERNAQRFETEARTLMKLLGAEAGSLWPPIVEALTVEKGYETALGAALGDDLDASTNASAPAHWTELDGEFAAPSLPTGVESLAVRVKGPASLRRRLSQIGVVLRGEGRALLPLLKPGQRLVSKEGDLWRWDGFVQAAEAPTPAARRLAEKNRLGDVMRDGEAARQALEALQEEAAGGLAAVREAAGAEHAARQNAREARALVEAARERQAEAERRRAEMIARLTALQEAARRAGASRAESAQRKLEAEAQIDKLAAGEELARELERARGEAVKARGDFAEARAGAQALAREAEARLSRRQAIAEDKGSWEQRRERAEAQVGEFETRQAQATTELEALADAPAAFLERRKALITEIDGADAARRAAGDARLAAEAALADAERAAKTAFEAMGAAREARAASDERLEAARERLKSLAHAIAVELETEPHALAGLAGVRSGDGLPDLAHVERRRDNLKQERERLGAVNLRADEELVEVEARRNRLVADREDLIEAIKRLRVAIGNLNKEGRERLLAAFGVVNTHFGELFSTLFEGGAALLQLVESDDPLEAGLELIARPPGKRAQTLTLLSGGEQALTALALIFAVFLTNPSPICVLDEVDAPLDDSNVERFCDLLDAMRKRADTRFVTITHNPITMARMDRLFGVTMAERGVSQIVSVDLAEAERFLEAG
jgi:chromosome segregation protein